MTKEPVIQDKIHLLMEETGCDQGEAELAITLAGYDLEKAVRTIATLLRHIGVAKGRFLLPQKNLYGLFILLADTKRRSLLRLRAVVSYNPALYETPLAGDWYDFEKALYAFRLWEGTLQQVSQDLERSLSDRLEKTARDPFFEALGKAEGSHLKDFFQRLVSGHFPGNAVGLELLREELNLDQYRRIKPGEDVGQRSPIHAAPSGGESLALTVQLQEEEGGVAARDVRAGDSVYVMISDDRDIAQYLAKLLGGRVERELKPLPAPVEAARAEGEGFHFQIRLSSGILGLAWARADAPVRMQKRASDRWWAFSRLFSGKK